MAVFFTVVEYGGWEENLVLSRGFEIPTESL